MLTQSNGACMNRAHIDFIQIANPKYMCFSYTETPDNFLAIDPNTHNKWIEQKPYNATIRSVNRFPVRVVKTLHSTDRMRIQQLNRFHCGAPIALPKPLIKWTNDTVHVLVLYDCMR